MLSEILELTELVYRVNEETEHDVFLDISGHVKSISFYGYAGGYGNPNNEKIKHISFYWDAKYTHLDAKATCKKIKNKLLELLGEVE